MLTVLQVIPALETGGAERATIDIAAALARRGDRALVASAGGRLCEELEQVGGTHVPVSLGSKNPIRIGTAALSLAGLVRAERVDLVHARSRAPAWAAWLSCRRIGVPFVTTFHGIYSERNRIKHTYNSVMARGDVVIANSEYTARLIKSRYGTPDTRVAVIPRGTDLLRFRPESVASERRQALRAAWGLKGNERVVLNLARLTGWKGQKVLIAATALLAPSDVTVVLAGDAQGRSQYRQELEDLIGAHGLMHRVRLVGHCDDAPAALALADVAVIASIQPEAFGRTAIEASAMGVPVVATALGATTETVLAPPHCAEGDRTGWLVPPSDASALASAIASALALSATERRALAVRAKRQAMHFTTEAMQAATLAVYDRLAIRGGGS